jgi:hypothetical protein
MPASSSLMPCAAVCILLQASSVLQQKIAQKAATATAALSSSTQQGSRPGAGPAQVRRHLQEQPVSQLSHSRVHIVQKLHLSWVQGTPAMLTEPWAATCVQCDACLTQGNEILGFVYNQKSLTHMHAPCADHSNLRLARGAASRYPKARCAPPQSCTAVVAQ